MAMTLFLVRWNGEAVAGPVQAESPERWMVATYGRFWRSEGYAVVELSSVSALMKARRS